MQNNKYRDVSNVELPDEVFRKTCRAFRKLDTLRMELDEKQKAQKEKDDLPYEEKIPYKSPFNIDNDIKVFGGPSISPQERMTMQFDEEHEALLKLSIMVADLEEALLAALDAAILQASISIRPRVKDGLEQHLIKGIPASMVRGISGHTLAKYRRIAIINAAINLKYVSYSDLVSSPDSDTEQDLEECDED